MRPTALRPTLVRCFAAALLAVIAVMLATPTEVLAQTDETNPAVYWRLERERQERAKRAAVIQRPTRMTRGVAPRRGFAVEVPADAAAAAAAAAAGGSESADGSASPGGEAAPGSALDAAVRPSIPARPTGPSFVIGVFGDNVAQLLAQGLSEAYADRNVTVLRRARENTGLVREDYHDWPKAIADFLASDQKIDLAVFMVGSNDRQAIRDGGQSAEVLSDRWRDAYRARALAVAEAFKRRNVPLVWVGMTVMKNERLSADLIQFNEIYREAAQKTGASFVDVWEPFVDERNRFTLSGPDLNGHVTRIRTGDGVHFTRAGARKLAHFVEGDVKRFLDQRTPTTPAPILVDAPAGQQIAPGPASAALAPAGPGDAPGLNAPSISVPAPAPVVTAPVRPSAGPVLPLTANTLSPGGELATRPSTRGDKGALDTPPPARTGRADDFSWPRQ